MNLNEAMGIEILRLRTAAMFRPKIVANTIGVKELTRAVYKMASTEHRPIEDIKGDWIATNIHSKKFTLVEAMTNSIADPGPRMNPNTVARILASVADNGQTAPIVVDLNKRRAGRILSLDYTPRAIVVDGREKFAAANMRGDDRILAWVGDGVLDYVRASTRLPDNELYEKIHDEFKLVWMQDSKDVLAEALPVIEQIFPLEEYFVFSYGDRRYKQQFHVRPDKDLDFVGKPRQIHHDYGTVSHVRGTIGSYIADFKDMAACGCGGVVAKSSSVHANCLSFASDSGSGTMELSEALKVYNSSEGAKRSKIRAVSPPGWEKSVEHMKDDHPEIDNPWALAWWMRDQGYHPHHPPGSDKKK